MNEKNWLKTISEEENMMKELEILNPSEEIKVLIFRLREIHAEILKRMKGGEWK